MENPTELGKRDAKSLTDAVSGKTKGKTKGKLAVKYNHQKHFDAAQHNLTNRRIEAAGDEPEQEDSKEDDGAEDAEAPTSAVDEPTCRRTPRRRAAPPPRSPARRIRTTRRTKRLPPSAEARPVSQVPAASIVDLENVMLVPWCRRCPGDATVG